ncbi:hypothetical protein PRUPE_3G016100 [Prunus persica]|uniref:Uncharacterized protein n=1 Tax=Prunus persica TaxID=3760 RepID=A0A251PTV1_PRUPE|nr:hypothetical protein PRUPE_3G016100 [Prunus persica]
MLRPDLWFFEKACKTPSAIFISCNIGNMKVKLKNIYIYTSNELPYLFYWAFRSPEVSLFWTITLTYMHWR